MFIHSSDIPVMFALSVYHILHNMADHHQWECLDEHPDHALEWIESIYASNNLPWNQQEMIWWQKHLSEAILN